MLGPRRRWSLGRKWAASTALAWVRYIRSWQELVRRGSWPRPEPTELPVNSSKRFLLLTGGALLGLGLAVGLVRLI
ncbi:hypothetical protein [Hyalangium minutum]|uniref:hypothetical protein n=1 Tax=Hyalangium minutum TaxID=394096 RepID=UPI0012FACC5C|nr:hypothetical protein [Hyalangium minutum]